MVTESTCETQEVLGRSGAQGTVAVPHRHPFLISDTEDQSWKETSSPTGRALSMLSAPLREVGGWVSPGRALPGELGRNPGHTIVVGTFDSGITRGHGGQRGNETCCGHTRAARLCFHLIYRSCSSAGAEILTVLIYFWGNPWDKIKKKKY